MSDEKLLKLMFKPLKKNDFRFFFNSGHYFVGIQIPGLRGYTIMDMGRDNRPFESIIADVCMAYEMLFEKHLHDGYTRDIAIANELPSLCGYRRTTFY